MLQLIDFLFSRGAAAAAAAVVILNVMMRDLRELLLIIVIILPKQNGQRTMILIEIGNFDTRTIDSGCTIKPFYEGIQ